jgi:putative tricarboxylic transport membrane protein
MGDSDRTSGLFFLCFGLFILVYTYRTLPLGTLAEPEAGLFPLLIGFLMTGFAAGMLFRSFRGKSRKVPEFGGYFRKVLFSGIAILGYVIFLESGGFLLCTFLFMFFYLKFIERLKWTGSLLFSGLTVGVTYFSFTQFLGVPLPQGIIPL